MDKTYHQSAGNAQVRSNTAKASSARHAKDLRRMQKSAENAAEHLREGVARQRRRSKSGNAGSLKT